MAHRSQSDPTLMFFPGLTRFLLGNSFFAGARFGGGITGDLIRRENFKAVEAGRLPPSQPLTFDPGSQSRLGERFQREEVFRDAPGQLPGIREASFPGGGPVDEPPVPFSPLSTDTETRDRQFFDRFRRRSFEIMNPGFRQLTPQEEFEDYFLGPNDFDLRTPRERSVQVTDRGDQSARRGRAARRVPAPLTTKEKVTKAIDGIRVFTQGSTDFTKIPEPHRSRLEGVAVRLEEFNKMTPDQLRALSPVEFNELAVDARDLFDNLTAGSVRAGEGAGFFMEGALRNLGQASKDLLGEAEKELKGSLTPKQLQPYEFQHPSQFVGERSRPGQTEGFEQDRPPNPQSLPPGFFDNLTGPTQTGRGPGEAGSGDFRGSQRPPQRVGDRGFDPGGSGPRGITLPSVTRPGREPDLTQRSGAVGTRSTPQLDRLAPVDRPPPEFDNTFGRPPRVTPPFQPSGPFTNPNFRPTRPPEQERRRGFDPGGPGGTAGPAFGGGGAPGIETRTATKTRSSFVRPPSTREITTTVTPSRTTTFQRPPTTIQGPTTSFITQTGRGPGEAGSGGFTQGPTRTGDRGFDTGGSGNFAPTVSSPFVPRTLSPSPATFSPTVFGGGSPRAQQVFNFQDAPTTPASRRRVRVRSVTDFNFQDAPSSPSTADIFT